MGIGANYIIELEEQDKNLLVDIPYDPAMDSFLQERDEEDLQVQILEDENEHFNNHTN